MKGISKFIKYLLIIAICIMCLIPFYVLLVLALNSPERVFYEGNIFVPDFCWQNFIDAWSKSKIGMAMLNSAIITAGTLGVDYHDGRVSRICNSTPQYAVQQVCIWTVTVVYDDSWNN